MEQKNFSLLLVLQWDTDAAQELKFFYQQVEYILDPTCIESSFLGVDYSSIVFAGEAGIQLHCSVFYFLELIVL